MREYIYIRFGNLPKGGRSQHVDGYDENGVSVFEGMRGEGQIYICTSGALKWALEAYLDENRPCWEVKGEEVDIGGDGEPLLSHVRKIRKIKDPRSLIPIDAKNQGWPEE